MLKLLSLLSLLAIFSTSFALAQGKGEKGGDKNKGGSGSSKGGRGGKGKGGLSGSGGGGGVICFANIEDAKESDLWLSKNQQLPNSILDKGRLRVLESWEMEQTKQPIWNAEAGATWEQHLETVQNAIRDRFPIFMYRLDQTSGWTQHTLWEDVQDLPLLDDAKPMTPLPENCRRVQLALRHSEGNNALGEGPVTTDIKVKIVFVKEYFSRLPVTDQAMLMFHEQLYVLGQSVGHSTSDFVRGINRLFFANSINYTPTNKELLYRSPAERLIRNYLITFMGDYVIYFHESNPFAAGEGFSSQRHFYRYLQLMLQQRELVGQCIETSEKKGISKDQCVPTVMKKYEQAENLTDEDSFVMVVAYIMEPYAHFNTDQVLDPAGRDPGRFQLAMQTMCSSIESNANPSFSMVRKAISYCKDWTSLYRPGK